MRCTPTAVIATALLGFACVDPPMEPTEDAPPPPSLSVDQRDDPAPVLPDAADEATIESGGDNPLATSFTFTGPVGVALDVIACNVACPPINFTVAALPASATVLQALVYVQRWNAPITSASATFAGNPLGPLAAFSVDPVSGFQLQSYRFDVTSFVPGNGGYSFTFSTGGGQNYYAALIVAYTDASLPSRAILINDGSEGLGPGTSTTSFAGLPVAGAGTLTVVTQADNVGGTESVDFNGATILGPGDVMNANLGLFASLHQLPVSVVAGANTATMSSVGDLFGWHLAILDAPGNRPPDCSAAAASPDALWPPNHHFVPIDVLGVTDPDGDPITITIDGIRQDEPTDTFGDGKFAPDGQGVGTSTAEVRAERAGTKMVLGNGRVYHISFTADDGQGGSCSSTVLVGVPHDQNGDPAVDDGPLYDSTLP